MTIFNLIMVVVALALFVILMGRIVKRIRSVEAAFLDLTNRFASMEDMQIEFKTQLNDVRKSLDNF